MITTVGKWGNSLAIRIPKDLANDIRLLEGMDVDIDVIDGNLVIRPKIRKRYTIDELAAGIAPENRHAEVDTGAVVREEAW
jgi:antitoxin MazE